MNQYIRKFLSTAASLLLCCPASARSQVASHGQGGTVQPGAAPHATDLVSTDASGHVYADIETSKGTIEVELDFKSAPLTCLNFVGLAEGSLPFQHRPAGKPFYDGLSFHRVVEGFVIQGGDPFSADPSFPADKLGDGGPGYNFPDEFGPGQRHDAAGVLAMANDGPDTNGSQFFITLAPVNRLNYLHSVFGQVVRGLEVVKQIAQGDRITHITIRRSGAGAEAVQADADHFEQFKTSVLAKRKAAPAGVTYLIDETKQLPDFRVTNFNYKLANYERATGHRIVVRLLAEFKSETPQQTMGNAVKKFAAAAGVTDEGAGAMVCFFAAQHAWQLRLGEATYPDLLDAAGTTEELMAKGIMHDKKAALTTAAAALTSEGKLKEGVDAMIDTLILKFDDHFLDQKPAASN